MPLSLKSKNSKMLSSLSFPILYFPFLGQFMQEGIVFFIHPYAYGFRHIYFTSSFDIASSTIPLRLRTEILLSWIAFRIIRLSMESFSSQDSLSTSRGITTLWLTATGDRGQVCSWLLSRKPQFAETRTPTFPFCPHLRKRKPGWADPVGR